MAALTTGVGRKRRGAPPSGTSFAYPVKAGVKIWRGGLLAVTSTGQLQPLGTVGSAAFVGLASKDYDNSASASDAAVSVAGVEADKGTYQLDVPAATHSNINAAVYATDDNTLTLTVGSNLQVGTLVGIEGGKTWVKLLGS